MTRTFLEFFAGSGLAAEGLRGLFVPSWANDICPKKAAVYRANHDSAVFRLASIEEVYGRTLPVADLAWASFPCQDLSLAGKMGGLNAKRSGLVWQCLRTPEGGSSRQTLVLKRDDRLCTRLLTVQEAARLMGAPKTFKLPGTYNDGYKAMGDAVVVPVVNFLGRHLLKPLADAAKRAHV